MIHTDYLVIGSGVAGLTFAVKIAEKFPRKTITIVTKGDEDESNTKYAQGGVAVVLDKEEDSFQKHIKDTLIAGDGLCDEAVVDMIIKEGPKRFKELIQWGANFDIDTEGKFDLGKEGGHSEYRVVHHKDITGFEVERTLLKRAHQLDNILLLAHHFAIDLVTEHHLESLNPKQLSCYGAYILNEKTGGILTINAKNTLLASGGIGRVYGHTTNPNIATGDGVAMAYRAKAQIKDMEFIQFHPTALYQPEGGSSFLISEAVRGFGAYLLDKNGHRFMLDYDDRAELASRDIVSQCIDKELKKSGDTHVFLDCRHLDIKAFKNHFPTIYDKCKSQFIDIEKDLIPVVPASHYLCGGIVVDKNGKTTINHLYSCGECSRTGLHGANRLASNSLLEALVYAHNIFKHLSSIKEKESGFTIPEWDDRGTGIPKEHVLIQHNLNELQALMRDYVGIVRSNDRLLKAITRLNVIYNEIEELYKKSKVNTSLCELRNMINVAHLIIGQSLLRKENKGGFYNSDNSKKWKMKDLIKNSVSNSLTYSEYSNLIKESVTQQKTTGNEQSEERIEFTKLNASRMRRLDKTTKLSVEAIEAFNDIPKQTWIVISESWCGDAAQTLPILNRIAENSLSIQLKIVLRDENLDLMDAFLTNGAQAVPKLIIVDENYTIMNTWGARSKAATQLVLDYKKEFGKIDAEFKKNLQVWYNNDKGQSIINDMLEITHFSTTLAEI